MGLENGRVVPRPSQLAGRRIASYSSLDIAPPNSLEEVVVRWQPPLEGAKYGSSVNEKEIDDDWPDAIACITLLSLYSTCDASVNL